MAAINITTASANSSIPQCQHQPSEIEVKSLEYLAHEEGAGTEAPRLRLLNQ